MRAMVILALLANLGLLLGILMERQDSLDQLWLANLGLLLGVSMERWDSLAQLWLVNPGTIMLNIDH